MGKSSKQETTQTNEPPAWAKPALETVGRDALNMYNNKEGYNTYTGPTQAAKSDTTINAQNALLAALGLGQAQGTGLGALMGGAPSSGNPNTQGSAGAGPIPKADPNANANAQKAIDDQNAANAAASAAAAAAKPAASNNDGVWKSANDVPAKDGYLWSETSQMYRPSDWAKYQGSYKKGQNLSYEEADQRFGAPTDTSRGR